MSTNLRVLVTNAPSQEPALRIDGDAVATRCKALGVEAEITVCDDPLALERFAGAADVIFTNHKFDIGRVRKASPRLKWVQVISAGVEAYLKTLPEGVILTNASGVHAEKGAEFILTSVLMLNYRIPFFTSRKVQRTWQPVFESVAHGKVATILGVGAIGGAAVPLLRARGIRVIGVTSRGETDAPVDECIALDALDTVLPGTDFLVSTLPLTPATEGRIGAEQFDLMPRGAGVVVVGRAKVLDYGALAARLESGHLGGAVLDVFPEEPVAESDAIWSMPNLVMTPHCSVDDHAGYIDRCLDIFGENLRRFQAGDPLLNVVSPDRGY
ncbi:D-2-hydroxyacid dehydrogenase [Rhizobiaceae bacterium BDR2-2]|uniref:D-2-hydroxyacid dehydrogenase n=1 Tax=Ectorhizobium quercum TaxID=2965071 RepID=A0AAE3N490_9HYPH|nr:D-2-hydroxyacid dehydrogenase [Ectorhizobium quercum]MCX8999702.1 D-2-hydroxyacid dehydrogenase [Ectorhizobium quercum]